MEQNVTKKILLSSLLSLAAVVSQAGKLPDIDGQIVGQDGEPVEFVNVVLLNKDSVFVQGATSDREGKTPPSQPLSASRPSAVKELVSDMT